MAAVMFDKFEFVKKLKEAGVPERQAEAQAEAISSAMTSSDAVTKDDIISQTKWYVGALIAVMSIFTAGVMFAVNSKIDAQTIKTDVQFSSLSQKVDAQLNALSQSIDNFNQLDKEKFNQINTKIDAINLKLDALAKK